MVECFDRMHLWLAEVVLKPLQQLQSDPSLSTVTIRPPGRGRRVTITVEKSSRDGSDQPPSYHWSAQEVDAAGMGLPDGREWSGDSPSDSPEAAYWEAVDRIAASRARRPVPV